MRVLLSIVACLAMASSSLLRADDVLTVADRLVNQHLAYIYGSEDPHKGGLDCSGFVQTVFRESCGIELPNEADKQLEYCRQHGQVWDSTSAWTPETLKPGDLIFFAGPYDLPRESRVIHVMMYCGYDTMMGAQQLGRREDGVIGGVGQYFFSPHFPNGILGESGERFIGHRRVFAYGRVNLGTGQLGQERIASWHVATETKAFGSKARID